jgi:hypothetical protein
MRALIQAAVLAIINLGAVLTAFILTGASRHPERVSVQILLAAVLVLILFWAWVLAIHKIAPNTLRIPNRRQAVFVYFLAFACSAAIFLPLHLFTQGYLTAFSNIFALWCFQAPVNAAGIYLALPAMR